MLAEDCCVSATDICCEDASTAIICYDDQSNNITLLSRHLLRGLVHHEKHIEEALFV